MELRRRCGGEAMSFAKGVENARHPHGTLRLMGMFMMAVLFSIRAEPVSTRVAVTGKVEVLTVGDRYRQYESQAS